MGKGSQNRHSTRNANKDRRQRIEELKQQQRAAERRKTMIAIGSGSAVGVVILGAAIVPAWMSSQQKKEARKVGYVAAASKDAKAAGCTGTRNDKVAPGGQHSTSRVDYNPVPPSSGTHSPDALPDQVGYFALDKNPAPERAVHNLEHGYVVGWYDAKLPAAEISKLQQLSAENARFLAVGWTRGDLPDGKHFVLTSWGRTQRCEQVSTTVVKDFIDKHADDRRLAPEAGAGGGPNSPVNLIVPTGSPAATPTHS